MIIDPSKFYDDKNYFYPNYKEFTDQFGVVRRYHGPAKEWHGFGYIAEFLKNNFEGVGKILDIGCSAGSFVSYASTLGFQCQGIDISRYAINHCVPGAKGKVKLADVTRSKPFDKFDCITGFDLMEHFYKSDVSKVYEYMRESLNPGGWLFLCIATARNESELWAHTGPGDEIPQDKSWLAVAGHVYIRYMEDWLNDFYDNGFDIHYKTMVDFALWKARHHEMERMEAWSIKNVLIGRKR